MISNCFRVVFGITVLGAAVLANAAGTLEGDYYVMASNNLDVEHGIDGSIVTGLVTSHLGADGLPVASAYGLSYSGPSGAIRDVNASNEIMWWSAGVDGTTFQKSEVDSNPFDLNIFPNGSSDGSDGYSSVHWQGDFDLTSGGSVTFTAGSDDDMFVYLDGNLVDDLGGVHGFAPAQVTTDPISAGNHVIDVFFADRHTTNSEARFDAQFTPSATPEPFTMALGVGGLATFMVRRKRG